MKQGIDHCGEEEMAPLSPTDRRNQRRYETIKHVFESEFGCVVSLCLMTLINLLNLCKIKKVIQIKLASKK